MSFSLTREKMQASVEGMAWSQPSRHPVAGNTLWLKTARATSEFWEAHRGLKDEWYEVGFSTTRRSGVWIVKWWSDLDGKFRVHDPTPDKH